MAGGGGGGEGEPEFQIAPMIDVLLTLLIFFMSITTAQVEQVDKGIKLPVAPNALERKPSRQTMVVNISWNASVGKATIKYSGKDYEDMEELQKAFEARAKGDPRTELLIRADRTCPAREIQKLMQIAALAGIDKIGYATYNTEG